MTDYSLWEVIKNGNKVPKKTVGTVKQIYKPTFVEEKLDMKNEMKARGTLLMSLPNKDKLKFHSYQDAKFLMKAIEKRLKKLISQLEIQGKVIEQEDINLKVQRSLPSEWKTHALIWRNKAKIETLSLDDLYKNFKIYKPELTGSSSTRQNPQNVDFVSSNSTNSTSSTNDADNTAYGVSIAHTQDRLKKLISQLEIQGKVIEQEDINLKVQRSLPSEWKTHALIWRNKAKIETLSLDDLYKNFKIYKPELTGSSSTRQNPQNVDFVSSNSTNSTSSTNDADNTAYGVSIAHTQGLQSVKERLGHYKKNDAVFKEKINILNLEVRLRDNALVEYTKKLEKAEKEIDEAASPTVENFVNSFKMIENQENFKSRLDKRYHAVPPPYTRNYIPPKLDLMFINEKVESESVDVVSNVSSSAVKTVESKFESVDVKNKGVYSTLETKPVKKNNFSSPIIKDWISDDESEGNPQQKEYKEKGIIDSGCSMHMIGNKCYHIDYEDYDGGFVSFGDHKGRISRKGKIKTGTLDFDDVHFCLTCVFAKATTDESNLWHMRLGNINYKTMNKLVSGSLARGLPLKIFKNNHGCVSCQKGKQHKASYKEKLVNSIIKPLHMLHMDLFGHTNVKSLMKKSYCLVITNDFSRFSWVFILAIKDEISGILKTFITGIENQLDCKVKVIRCDNGIEFKNSVMNQLCDMKGIKREFSVARTPQQNGVAERKNRTLIEAARTMLVDYKLPTTFWAEAVNIACYVLNRALVIKPHNKTPYELICGTPPLIDFMKPFGCPVTILNTRDYLGKFDEKANEGFFVGYCVTIHQFQVVILFSGINYNLYFDVKL
nr:putative ribonuclease H-like domain-containing protein [Tanacetum cinerariifolium]